MSVYELASNIERTGSCDCVRVGAEGAGEGGGGALGGRLGADGGGEAGGGGGGAAGDVRLKALRAACAASEGALPFVGAFGAGGAGAGGGLEAVFE